MPHTIVEMPDGTTHKIQHLFGRDNSNAKIAKNKGVVSRYLAMKPWKVAGHPELGNLCSHASIGCRTACLDESGNALVFGADENSIIKRGRLARRVLYLKDTSTFTALWHKELALAEKLARKKGDYVFCRPNLLSDVDWTRKHPGLVEDHPTIQFVDYTKDAKKYRRFLDGKLPKNYYLTFSRSENNEKDCIEFLGLGGNVTVVFSTKPKKELPESWHGFRVVDGDLDDMRHLDPAGVVVGLRAKGKLRRKKWDHHGFVVSA